MDRPKWSLWPPAIFAVIVLSFLAATGFGQWRMRVLDHAVVEIAITTAPSVEHLASARGAIRNLQALLRERDANDADSQHVSRETAALEEARRTLDEATNAYLVLPVAPGERPIWRGIFDGRTAVDRATSPADSKAAVREPDAALARGVAFNASRSRELAVEVTQLRERGLYVAFVLDVVCTAIAVAGAIVLRRMVRVHDELAARHLTLERERAAALEQFAGRVAHDILSPLSTVGIALQLADHAGDEQARARVLERGTSALRRVKRIVSGLLDFARAGAKPDGDVRANVAEIMSDLAAELGPTAKAARPVRRIEVRALDRGDRVKVEVEDTGPGLSPDIEARVFDAYSRSRSTTQPGIGLGLATVKRLAQAHGGTVGVRSVLGSGCTFWFELPRARNVIVDPEDEGRMEGRRVDGDLSGARAG